MLRQRPHGRKLEEFNKLHLKAEVLADPILNLNQKKGMAAQVKEASVQAHGLNTKDIPPDRRDIRRSTLARNGLYILRCPGRRNRKRAPIKLAIGVQGQLREEHEGTWNHVLRERAPQSLAKLVLFGWDRRLSNDVGDEPLISGAHRLHHGDCGTNLRKSLERCIDLPQLDTEATKLYLKVQAPEKVESAIRTPAHPVSGDIEAPPRLRRVGVRAEAFRCQTRTAVVPPSQVGATEKEFPFSADGSHFTQAIKH